MKPKRFSVIIPNFNGKHLLRPCLESLRSCNNSQELAEFIVVDNGSTDGSCEFIKTKFPEIKILKLPQNTGFTGAITAGVATAQGEFVIFLNNDMHVSCDWLLAYETYLLNNQNVCATGLILSWDGKRIDFIKGILLFDGHALQMDQGKGIEYLSILRPSNTFIACGGNMAVKRDLFLRLGGFDQDFFAYTEDVDFSWRLHLAEKKIMFIPEAKVFHHHHGTSNNLGVYRRGFLYERNAFITLYKNIDALYFDQMLHAAWITLLHRTREILALQSNAASVLGKFPFSEYAEALYDSQADQRTEIRLWQSGLKIFKKYGALYTLGRTLAWLGEIIQNLSKKKIIHPPNSQHQVLDIGHPHIVSQLQAIWYILANMERLTTKRKEVQKFRKISDKEIFSEFSPWIVSTYPGDERLFSSAWFNELLPPDINFKFAKLSDIHGAT